MDELTKNETLGDLYAYYGALLTKGQQSYFEDYYYNDLSLGEIAQNHQVSRQAVYDNLKRSSKILQNFEAKLKMQQEFDQIETVLIETITLLENGDNKTAQNKLKKLLQQLRGE